MSLPPLLALGLNNISWSVKQPELLQAGRLHARQTLLHCLHRPCSPAGLLPLQPPPACTSWCCMQTSEARKRPDGVLSDLWRLKLCSVQAPKPSRAAGTTGKKRKAYDGKQQSAAGTPQAGATLAKGSSEAAGLLSPGPSLGADETFRLADLSSHAREALQTCIRSGRAATAAGK